MHALRLVRNSFLQYVMISSSMVLRRSSRAREQSPLGYLRVIAHLLPRDVNLNIRPLDDLSDEQLLRRLQQVTELARPLLIDITPSAVGVDVVCPAGSEKE